MYERSCDELAKNSDCLMEYDNRTLYSTWNLSLKWIAARDPEAAELFRLMGYLGNVDLWYELFKKGADFAPDWFRNIIRSKVRLNKVMATLHSYSLIEVVSDHHSINTYVHDWILEYLIGNFESTLFSLAIFCVTQNAVYDYVSNAGLINNRLIHHVLRIEQCQREEAVDWNVIDKDDISCLGFLNRFTGTLKEAEMMYELALSWYEKDEGPEHVWSLSMANALGSLYLEQGKNNKVESLIVRALKGQEMVLGVKHKETLITVSILGYLYHKQGRADEAKMMYLRTRKGEEKLSVIEDTLTLRALDGLSLFYLELGKIDVAERTKVKAL